MSGRVRFSTFSTRRLCRCGGLTTESQPVGARQIDGFASQALADWLMPTDGNWPSCSLPYAERDVLRAPKNSLWQLQLLRLLLMRDASF